MTQQNDDPFEQLMTALGGDGLARRIANALWHNHIRTLDDLRVLKQARGQEGLEVFIGAARNLGVKATRRIETALSGADGAPLPAGATQTVGTDVPTVLVERLKNTVATLKAQGVKDIVDSAFDANGVRADSLTTADLALILHLFQSAKAPSG
ncbi:hypothetical protein [Streptomyces sp. NBC_01304]|uniref:hypothetical protein n=1 Tax=Streptomyces sp. NBC_01304 TaxID=2903818 RepID=UPI002E132381|nr:hypothetical protein OG430_48505 [Streptomyces sp. NBC_01304]